MKLPTVNTSLSDISEEPTTPTAYRTYFLGICVLYTLAAGVLALQARYGVMDEDFHLAASEAFAKGGINLTTLYNHLPPTGVASHIWFALWMKLFPGIDYIGLRLITCAGLLVVAGFAYRHLHNRSVISQHKVLGASWFMLVCPYFFVTVSTIQTEGPALIFLFSGLLLLSTSGLKHFFPFFLGCLLLGFTTIARFYYLPLLPALFILLVTSDWEYFKQYGLKEGVVNRGLLYLSIGIGLLPLAGLVLLWGGFTPPLFHQWSKLRSGVSFNQLRPISALLITGLYIAPFVLANLLRGVKPLARILAIALPLALMLGVFRINLFHDSLSVSDVFSGPVEHGVGWVESRGRWGLPLGLFALYSISLVSLYVFIGELVSYVKVHGFTDKGFLFSLTFVIFFIVSQVFIGGNHPFFERYLIHPWPFLGYILVQLTPDFFKSKNYLLLIAYTIFSVLILLKWG
ncbi:hypothetical protein [Spirosoma litoris]